MQKSPSLFDLRLTNVALSLGIEHPCPQTEPTNVATEDHLGKTLERAPQQSKGESNQTHLPRRGRPDEETYKVLNGIVWQFLWKRESHQDLLNAPAATALLCELVRNPTSALARHGHPRRLRLRQRGARPRLGLGTRSSTFKRVNFVIRVDGSV